MNVSDITEHERISIQAQGDGSHGFLEPPEGKHPFPSQTRQLYLFHSNTMAAMSMISDDEGRTIYYSFTKLVDVLPRSLTRVIRSSFMSLSEVLTRSVGRYACLAY